MIINICYFIFSLLISVRVYLELVYYLSLEGRGDIARKINRCFRDDLLSIGLLFTFIGFFIGVEGGLTPESVKAAMQAALPSSILAFVTYFAFKLIDNFIGKHDE